jgi:hypothetical protein
VRGPCLSAPNWGVVSCSGLDCCCCCCSPSRGVVRFASTAARIAPGPIGRHCCVRAGIVTSPVTLSRLSFTPNLWQGIAAFYGLNLLRLMICCARIISLFGVAPKPKGTYLRIRRRVCVSGQVDLPDQRIQLLASLQFAGGRIATVEGPATGGQSGKHILTSRFTAHDPSRTSSTHFCCDAQHGALTTKWW